ncbi:cytochrome-c peroxidase [Limnoglobus roseus]|uniref:Cytochrome C peroxidase n=1 Tax=Limnoglobus roseus TaxID=2598579 RepID=A0A5C1AIR2_9BACT|nr:cytochrome c peroxidase [Limnoglobus roseus]QEL18133.1 cytochrome C peroxidase [Limnoglobus roseus]
MNRWLYAFVLGLGTLPAIAAEPLDVLLPNESIKIPFKDDVPIVYVTRNSGLAEWNKLPGFWSEGTQPAVDPATGTTVTRKVIKIKVPLGLSTAPPVPTENPMTLAKWNLGKKLFFENKLSSNAKVSCATCHHPAKGYTDQSQFSSGINNLIGGANAPTVYNSAYNRFQFWDGRGSSLEDQSQGPVGNAKEMFAGSGQPWDEAVLRLRANPEYVKAFGQVFGHAPTRDGAAKAIAAYERTVLIGNSIYDRAEVAMKKRLADDDTGGKPELKAEDFTAVLKDAITKKDTPALSVLGGEVDADAMSKRLVNGRNLFFGKARCTNCHVGDNFTDGLFHNLGVGAINGVLPKEDLGRYGALPTGHKDPTLVGAYKTPGLRGLADTAPYLHDGSEKTLEAVIEFYDRGGNVNSFLDEKMRDTTAELAYLKAKAAGQPLDPTVKVFTPNGAPIIPFKLNLTKEEKADLVLFMKALQGDPVDPIVADPTKFVGS